MKFTVINTKVDWIEVTNKYGLRPSHIPKFYFNSWQLSVRIWTWHLLIQRELFPSHHKS